MHEEVLNYSQSNQEEIIKEILMLSQILGSITGQVFSVHAS